LKRVEGQWDENHDHQQEQAGVFLNRVKQEHCEVHQRRTEEQDKPNDAKFTLKQFIVVNE
jgi:hypothetical protein